MRFWLTTHWPPREDAPNNQKAYIWLPHGRQRAGALLRKGDLVLVYESRSGRAEIRRDVRGIERRVRCIAGKEGIVAIGQVTSGFRDDPTIEADQYADGTSIHWRWRAPIQHVSRSGFVCRSTLNDILGYSPGYNYRGFGDRHSGLKELPEEQFYTIADEFTKSSMPKLPALRPTTCRREGAGGESEAHKKLKEYVASNPSLILMERGLKTVGMEYPFPTGDRADLVLVDYCGRVVGVEIEVTVPDDAWEGPLQAIKYRYMLEALTRREPGDSRSMLIAYSISPGIRGICARYGIECHEIRHDEITAWATGRGRDVHA